VSGVSAVLPQTWSEPFFQQTYTTQYQSGNPCWKLPDMFLNQEKTIMMRILYVITFGLFVVITSAACVEDAEGVGSTPIALQSCERSCVGKSKSGCKDADENPSVCTNICVGFVSLLSTECQEKVNTFTACQNQVGYSCNRGGYTVEKEPSQCAIEREAALNCNQSKETPTKQEPKKVEQTEATSSAGQPFP
jgi:hypothetical protein